MPAPESTELPPPRRPWVVLRQRIESGEATSILECLESMGPTETARAISRLDPAGQIRLFELLPPIDAAEILEEVSDTQAADLIEELSPGTAAAILDVLPSDDQADVLGDLDEADAEAILERMEPGEAADARSLLAYPPDTAGGLMVSEVLAFRGDRTLESVLTQLERGRDGFAHFEVQYLYVTDARDRLTGVLRMRDLLFHPRSSRLDSLMIRDPLRVEAGAGLESLRDFFQTHALFGAPVVDVEGRLVGVVLPAALEEARRDRAVSNLLGLAGIIGGEEFRSMPLLHRSGRRLSWLTLNILLNILAASIIAIYQDTLAAAITLAVFLPMVSDMSGCSGNQAVAVSLRELSLGLVRPHELLRVLGKEASLGVISGLTLGTLLGGVALLWKGNPYLGLVVGGALAANTVVAVCLGGLLPLLLKRFRMDPALVSGPLLTTVTDMCGFLFVLGFATAVLPQLG